MDNWGLVEVAWTLVAAFGSYFSFLNIKDSQEDARILKSHLPLDGDEREWRREIALIVANGTFRRELIRTIVHVSFFGLGILAGFTPVNPNPSFVAQLVGFFFIGLSLLLSLSTRGDYVDRKRMLALGIKIKQLEEEEHAATT